MIAQKRRSGRRSVWVAGASAAAIAFLACRPAPRPQGVVVAYPSGPMSLVPDIANEEFAISVLGNLYEALVDLDARLAVRPGLAASWYNEDELSWGSACAPAYSSTTGRRWRRATW